ncbi:EF-hand_domain pair [Hexamita inflata]|uniref:EF-hand domain pair n=1 Tax=Hexamita inflata TaxID=28002 RepID=A0AA86TQF7_9EUKA|nr:EF-hand domain pair [Hexamita inflata]
MEEADFKKMFDKLQQSGLVSLDSMGVLMRSLGGNLVNFLPADLVGTQLTFNQFEQVLQSFQTMQRDYVKDKQELLKQALHSFTYNGVIHTKDIVRALKILGTEDEIKQLLKDAELDKEEIYEWHHVVQALIYD